MVCYDEGRTSGKFSKESPLPLLNSFYEFNEAIRSGRVITFAADGPDAARAIDVIKDLLAAPTNRAEALLEWVAGGPVRVPGADGPVGSLEEETRKRLEAWGLLEAVEAVRGAKGPRPAQPRGITRDVSQAINRRF